MRKSNDIRTILRLSGDIDIINIEKENNNLVVQIKSNKEKVRCPKCGVFTKSKYDTLKPSKIKYLKQSEQTCYLIVTKRRFYCKECCIKFTEDIGISSSGCNISNALKQKVLKDLMKLTNTFTSVANDNGLSVNEVKNIFIEATKTFPDSVSNLPDIISFDETSTYTAEGTYSFILNDPIHKTTLDILKSRKKEFLIDYFLKLPRSIRNSVRVVICDLYVPYYEVVKVCFPNAIFVADPFHYTRYVTDGLDKIRLRIMNENSKNSLIYKKLKNRTNKSLLLKSFNETRGEIRKEEKRKINLISKNKEYKEKNKYNDFWYKTIKIKKNNCYIDEYRINLLNSVINIDNDLKNAYILKEEFMRIMINVKYKEAKSELKKWIKRCMDSEIPEMIDAAKTINNWLDSIVNSFLDERYNNGFTEANNNVITKIINSAYGIKNFEIMRKRVLVILKNSYSLDEKMYHLKSQK